MQAAESHGRRGLSRGWEKAGAWRVWDAPWVPGKDEWRHLSCDSGEQWGLVFSMSSVEGKRDGKKGRSQKRRGVCVRENARAK